MRNAVGPGMEDERRRILKLLSISPSTVSNVALHLQLSPNMADDLIDDLADHNLIGTKPSGSTGPFADEINYLTGEGRRELSRLKHSSEGSAA